MSISKEGIKRAVISLMTTANDVNIHYDETEFDSVGELIEIVIDEAEQALKLEFRGE